MEFLVVTDLNYATDGVGNRATSSLLMEPHSDLDLNIIEFWH